MSNKELAPAQAGVLRADGTFVVSSAEKPNGWEEIHRVGKLKIRGEREARIINYNDYAKLLTFYNAQERLIKDRKHIMVTLSDGLLVNTADITSLEQAEEQHFTAKTATVSDEIRSLPTRELVLDLNGKIIAYDTLRKTTKHLSQDFIVAKCHYREDQDGKRDYLTDLSQIPEALRYRNAEDQEYPPMLVQNYKYGIPQL